MTGFYERGYIILNSVHILASRQRRGGGLPVFSLNGKLFGRICGIETGGTARTVVGSFK